MRTVHLPWESVTGPQYRARELKPRKKWVTVGGWIASILLILGGLAYPKYWFAVIFGALYVLTLLMQKDVVITTRGLEIFYQMHITTQYDFWSWEDIHTIIREDKKHPELVALHIGKGDRSKRLFFTRADAQAIMDLARKQSHKILVADADESKMNGSVKSNRKKHT